MGNFASILSAPLTVDESEVSIGKIDDAKIQTPARFHHREAQRTNSFDPRSPTVDIDRTPILLEKQPIETRMNAEDPRSPTFGITRTPVALGFPLPPKPIDWNTDDITISQEINKEREQLMQVLDFTELDSINPTPSEEDSLAVEEAVVAEPVLPVMEEPLEFSYSSLTSSTPAPSPIKSLPKVKHIIDKENSVVKSQSPSALTTSRRVPFGDVNRSATSSPRLQLQNRQKQNVRTVIQGNTLKID